MEAMQAKVIAKAPLLLGKRSGSISSPYPSDMRLSCAFMAISSALEKALGESFFLRDAGTDSVATSTFLLFRFSLNWLSEIVSYLLLSEGQENPQPPIIDAS